MKPLNPLLVYIDQENLRYSFEKAFKERPTAWADFFIEYYTTNGYGKARNLTGFEGTMDILEARKKLENEIFEQLDLKKVKVDNSSYNREQHKELLGSQLKEAILQNS